jgi:hypothetical protein
MTQPDDEVKLIPEENIQEIDPYLLPSAPGLPEGVTETDILAAHAKGLGFDASSAEGRVAALERRMAAAEAMMTEVIKLTMSDETRNYLARLKAHFAGKI